MQHRPFKDGRPRAPGLPGRVVLVFQGGGALGAYQAGVYQGLHEAGIEPDWIIGTSIGAINASLIAGNAREDRVSRLSEFWARIADRAPWAELVPWAQAAQALSNWNTVSGGVPGFFAVNPFAFLGPHVPLGSDAAGYYSTAPLKATLLELVDFARINQGRPRLTVGAAHVRSSQMRYFDASEGEIGVEHILASGALPPAFPAVRIAGELYWDGGILSNTPTEVIFDENPRVSSLVFAVHMWNPVGPEPQSMWEVMHRQKDIQYSSRVATHIARQKEAHRLRHVIRELMQFIPEAQRASVPVAKLASFGCLTQMHVVRLLAPRLGNEDHTKDVDFSGAGIARRWQAGYAHARDAIAQAPWEGSFDPLEGVILHEPATAPSLEETARGGLAQAHPPRAPAFS
jgi:NTE family protein